MAEGGAERDPLLEHQDDKKHTEDKEGTLDFNPFSSSTPRNQNPGDTFKMWTQHNEKSGLPDISYAETNFGGTPSTEEIERRLNALRDKNTGLLNMSEIELKNILSDEDKQKGIQTVKALIKALYPNFKFDSLDIRYSQKNLNQIVVVGPRGRETKIVLDDGVGLWKDFLNKTFVKNALGDNAETIIRKTSASIKKNKKSLS